GTVNASTPLPIIFNDFKAIAEGSRARLSWETLSEQNNMGFDVEHSPDGKLWHSIGFVYSKMEAGHSKEKQAYSFVDHNPSTGYNLYRLKQIDFDGNKMYSGIRKV